MDLSADRDGIMAVSIGSVSRFDWKSKIVLKDQERFVEFYREIDGKFRAISVKKDRSNLNFVQRSSDILKFGTGDLMGEKVCDVCPPIPALFKFNEDLFYLTGNRFWLLFYSQNRLVIRYDRSTTQQMNDIKPSLNPAARPFFSPDFDAFALALEPVVPGNFRTMALFDLLNRVESEANIRSTAFLIGDLDSVDRNGNGREIIRFSDDFINSIEHVSFDAGGRKLNPDEELQRALNESIGATKEEGKSNIIDSAFVRDVNNDGFVDFIYSRNGSVYVTSYMGRTGRDAPKFEHWHDPVLRIVEPGEFVKSVLAVELSDDNLPELVVETNKAVHFYQNTP
jgi:hypothetical protein